MKKGKDRKDKTSSVSLFKLLVILVSGLAVLIMVVSVSIFMMIYNNALIESAKTNSQQTISQVAKALNIYLSGIYENVDLIKEAVNTNEDYEALHEYMDTLINIKSDIVSVFTYDLDGTVLDYSAEGKTMKDNLENNLSFDREMFEENRDIFITTPHVQNAFVGEFPWVVTVGVKTESAYYGREVYIAVDIRFSSIAKHVDNVGIGQRGYCYVLGPNDTIIYHPQQQLLFSGLKSEDFEAVNSMRNGVYANDTTIYSTNMLDYSDWRVVGVSYVEELVSAKVDDVILVVAAIFVCVMAITFVLIIIFSNIVSHPIRDLANAMKAFEKNAVKFKYMPVKGIREINILSESFEHMVKQIQELMERVKNEEITLRKTELKALQAQINPHFLYNTLDSIQWMCEQNKMQESVKMVGALAQLFRISINRGKEFVTIERELNHAESYLIIQSFRYKNQFTYRFDVDESILGYGCNKITLQPIIENAIYHGLGRMIDEGEIVISARADGDDIVFKVSDNGVGMTQEQCENILKNESSGIGIKNVNDRLKIYFGEKYGVTIESTMDIGTTIIIRFPKIGEDEYEIK